MKMANTVRPLELISELAIMRRPGRGGFPGGVVMGMA
jgi:hypothetical protein